jgi:hypothetical protein
MMKTMKLTEDDVKSLLTNPSGEQRAKTAAKIAASFDPEGLVIPPQINGTFE